MALMKGDAENDRRIHPFTHDRGDRGRGEQDVNERLMELQKEAHPFAEALLRGHLVQSKLPLPHFHLGLRQPARGVALELRGGFFGRELVPGESGEFFHRSWLHLLGNGRVQLPDCLAQPPHKRHLAKRIPLRRRFTGRDLRHMSDRVAQLPGPLQWRRLRSYIR